MMLIDVDMSAISLDADKAVPRRHMNVESATQGNVQPKARATTHRHRL